MQVVSLGIRINIIYEVCPCMSRKQLTTDKILDERGNKSNSMKLLIKEKQTLANSILVNFIIICYYTCLSI